MKDDRFKTKIIFKRLLSIILAGTVVLGSFAFSGTTALAAKSGNLLTNPGAEKGTLKGWTDSSKEKCWMIGYEGIIKGWEHPKARSGKYYFMTGWPDERNKNRYLYQNVKISSYIGDTLTFSAWLGGYGHTDKGGLKLEIRDKNGKVLAKKSSKMLDQNFGEWGKRLSVSLKVPSGAYMARAYLVGSLQQGDECDAYFDDLTLIASNKKPNAGVVSKISNKTGAKAGVTVKKISGAKSYQIRYKVGNAKTWTTKTSTSNTFTVSVGKGKKIKVQARVKNKYGWGKYGNTKSFTTDKK